MSNSAKKAQHQRDQLDEKLEEATQELKKTQHERDQLLRNLTRINKELEEIQNERDQLLKKLHQPRMSSPAPKSEPERQSRDSISSSDATASTKRFKQPQSPVIPSRTSRSPNLSRRDSDSPDEREKIEPK